MIDPIDRNTALGITEECAKSLKWILSDEDLSESERKECEWKLSFVESIISDLKNVPSIAQRQEPCEDAVSRKAAVEEIRRHGVGSFDFEDYTPEQAERFVIKLLQDLPSVTPKPCEDAVSRKELLKLFSNNTEGSWTYDTVAIGYIKALPSVMPERHTCDTCKHYQPSKKWPCVDCNMRNPADRRETDMR